MEEVGRELLKVQSSRRTSKKKSGFNSPTIRAFPQYVPNITAQLGSFEQHLD